MEPRRSILVLPSSEQSHDAVTRRKEILLCLLIWLSEFETAFELADGRVLMLTWLFFHLIGKVKTIEKVNGIFLSNYRLLCLW